MSTTNQTNELNDHELLMQVALFVSLEPSKPYSFIEGQVEWLSLLLEEAKEFCDFTSTVDWSNDDWYEASNHWMSEVTGRYES